ncbi:MAG: helix-turn-helix domain-containing protein [Candidatus Magnetoovum sp. WYHC-5]|nr:helix-turn-helix domain-containing protein [Candidatus Magnetoovum sp. WYHC-5]
MSIIISSLKDKVIVMEKEEITKALNDCNWKKSEAAKRLGITERMITYRIKKYHIKKECDVSI